MKKFEEADKAPIAEQLERKDMIPVVETTSKKDDGQDLSHISVLDVESREPADTAKFTDVDGRRNVVMSVALTIFICGVVAALVVQYVVGSSLFGFGLTFAGVILAFEAYLLYKKCKK